MRHHDESIAGFVDRVRDRPDVLGVIVVGSVARAVERPDSDVDLCLVLTDEAFSKAWRQNRLSYVEREGATYEGGYFDIKVATVEFLHQAAERGDDPTRASFLGARVAWSRIDDLDELVATVPALPEQAWERRTASFIAQVRLHGGYFLKQAVSLDNKFLLHHSAVHMVGAGGRALLALNRTLFQGQKYLDKALASLQRVPDGYAEAARAVLDRPGLGTAAVYQDLLEEFHPWPLTRDETLSTFVRDNELAWYTRTAPTEYA